MVPFQVSVDTEVLGPLLRPPAKAKAAVEVPQLPIQYLAVFKSFTSVQLVPFQVSVTAPAGVPPKAKDAVLVAPAVPI